MDVFGRTILPESASATRGRPMIRSDEAHPPSQCALILKRPHQAAIPNLTIYGVKCEVLFFIAPSPAPPPRPSPDSRYAPFQGREVLALARRDTDPSGNGHRAICYTAMQTEMASPCEAQPKRGEVGGGQCHKITSLPPPLPVSERGRNKRRGLNAKFEIAGTQPYLFSRLVVL